MRKPGTYLVLMGASAFIALFALISVGVIVDMGRGWLLRFIVAPLFLAEITFAAIAIFLLVRE